MLVKNSNDIIGNRTRDLPTCSALSQPTALPRAPLQVIEEYKVLVFEEAGLHDVSIQDDKIFDSDFLKLQ